jgi:hypothetical protein
MNGIMRRLSSWGIATVVTGLMPLAAQQPRPDQKGVAPTRSDRKGAASTFAVIVTELFTGDPDHKTCIAADSRVLGKLVAYTGLANPEGLCPLPGNSTRLLGNEKPEVMAGYVVGEGKRSYVFVNEQQGTGPERPGAIIPLPTQVDKATRDRCFVFSKGYLEASLPSDGKTPCDQQPEVKRILQSTGR